MGMDTQVKKVAAPKVAKPKEEREKKVRPAFDFASAVDATGSKISLDAEGRLTGIPANYSEKFAKLERSNFASRELFFNHRASMIDTRIAALQERKQELLARAAGKAQDPVAKNKKKLEKMRKQMAELEALLKAEGVNV